MEKYTRPDVEWYDRTPFPGREGRVSFGNGRLGSISYRYEAGYAVKVYVTGDDVLAYCDVDLNSEEAAVEKLFELEAALPCF